MIPILCNTKTLYTKNLISFLIPNIFSINGDPAYHDIMVKVNNERKVNCKWYRSPTDTWTDSFTVAALHSTLWKTFWKRSQTVPIHHKQAKINNPKTAREQLLTKLYKNVLISEKRACRVKLKQKEHKSQLIFIEANFLLKCCENQYSW